MPSQSVENISSAQFQDPNFSPDSSDCSDSETEQNDEIYYNEMEEIEVWSNRSQTAPTGRSPRLEEVIEIRDICHDGPDGNKTESAIMVTKM